jgi:hypothetical protein
MAPTANEELEVGDEASGDSLLEQALSATAKMTPATVDVIQNRRTEVTVSA